MVFYLKAAFMWLIKHRRLDRLACRRAVLVTLLPLVMFAWVPQRAMGATDDARFGVISELIRSGQAQQALDRLLTNNADAELDPHYHYWVGVAALETNSLELALNSFERAVLLNPGYAGAWLELAIVHFRLGDTETAVLLIEHVERNFAADSRLARDLVKAKEELRRSVRVVQWAGEIEFMHGHVQNANAGLGSSLITLTPVGGDPIALTVDPSQRATPDWASIVRAVLARRAQVDADTTAELLLNVRGRVFVSQRDYDQTDLGVVGALNRRYGEQVLQGALGVRHIRLGSRSLGQIYVAQSAVKIPAPAGCYYETRFDAERKEYSLGGYFSGTTPWIGVSTTCSGANLYWTVGYRYGVDRADAQRPGGVTQRQEAYGQINWVFKPNWSLSMAYLLGYATDRDPYSSLLDNGSRRRVTRNFAKLGLSRHLADLGYRGIYVSAYYEYLNDESNIKISSLRDRQAFLGLRYVFSGLH